MIDRFQNAMPAPVAPAIKPRQNPGPQDAFSLLLSRSENNAAIVSRDALELLPDQHSQDFLTDAGEAEIFLQPHADSENEHLVSDSILMQDANLVYSEHWESQASEVVGTNFNVQPSISVVSTNEQVQGAGGKIELISSPWHLIANAGMSYQSSLGSAAQKSSQLANQFSAALLAVESESKAINISKSNVFSESISAAIDKNVASSWLNQMSGNNSRLAQTFEVTRKAATESNASSMLWPKRSLHLVSDSEGGTAWVRDYQLEKTDAEKLFSSIRCLAEQQNFILRRIMLNGHEVWRASSTL
jgi:hypothetical protein